MSCLMDNSCVKPSPVSRPLLGWPGPPPPIGHRASLAALHDLAPSLNCYAAGTPFSSGMI